MSDFWVILAVLHVPATLICAVFYGAGRLAHNDRVGRWLRRSAVVWLVLIWVGFTFIALAAATCGGDMLYGYNTCRIIPEPLADLSVLVFFLLAGLGSLYGVALAAICAVVEWRTRT